MKGGNLTLVNDFGHYKIVATFLLDFCYIFMFLSFLILRFVNDMLVSNKLCGS